MFSCSGFTNILTRVNLKKTCAQLLWIAGITDEAFWENSSQPIESSMLKTSRLEVFREKYHSVKFHKSHRKTSEPGYVLGKIYYYFSIFS